MPGPDDTVRIFAYGSLMWDPAVPVAEARPARLAGWHRAMCVWTILARGTPDRPGLSLGLLPGGHCDGLLLEFPREHLRDTLVHLWQREMWTDVYRPLWLEAEYGNTRLSAVAFVANPESRQYAGQLSLDETRHYIATASGQRGSSRDYLVSTIEKLREHSIEEPDLARLAPESSA
jgi:cation transport protein ChaC